MISKKKTYDKNLKIIDKIFSAKTLIAIYVVVIFCQLFGITNWPLYKFLQVSIQILVYCLIMYGVISIRRIWDEIAKDQEDHWFFH